MGTEYQSSSERADMNMLSDGQKSSNSKRFQPPSSWCTIRRIKMTFTGQVQKLNPVITTVFASLLVTASALTPNFWQVEELVSNIHLPPSHIVTLHRSWIIFLFFIHMPRDTLPWRQWKLGFDRAMDNGGADQFAQMRKLIRASFVRQKRSIISVYGLWNRVSCSVFIWSDIRFDVYAKMAFF